jgi:hypothetical protein
VEHENFDLSWDPTLEFSYAYAETTTQYKITGPININVSGVGLNIRGNVILDLTTDFISGESAPANGIGYVYLDKFGKFYLSNTSPRKFDLRKGAYHPTEYYRCISALFTTDIGSAILEGSGHTPSSKTISCLFSNAETFQTCGTDYTLMAGQHYIPPMVNTVTFKAVAVSGVTAYFSHSIKEVTPNSKYLQLAPLFLCSFVGAGNHNALFWAEVDFMHNALIYMLYTQNPFNSVTIEKFKINL